MKYAIYGYQEPTMFERLKRYLQGERRSEGASNATSYRRRFNDPVPTVALADAEIESVSVHETLRRDRDILLTLLLKIKEEE